MGWHRIHSERFSDSRSVHIRLPRARDQETWRTIAFCGDTAGLTDVAKLLGADCLPAGSLADGSA